MQHPRDTTPLRRSLAQPLPEGFSAPYLKAFDAIDGFEWRGERSFFKWIATIAEYVIRGLGRAPRAGTIPLEADAAASGPSPSRAARREERFDRLEAALEALSEDHRTVIRLARIEGLPTSEVARRMGRSQGAVRHLLLRALESLRASFGDETESLNLPDLTFGCDKGESRGD